MDSLMYSPSDAGAPPIPQVDGCVTLIDGELRPWKGPSVPVLSPIRRQQGALVDGKDEIV